jgi:prepilin-type N-terminal cleavage/methylation domain-containing protein
MKNKLQKGFTVLEFLIVIAIIMILLAIILPSLQTARERSYDEKRVTDLKTISLELEQFKQACGGYPNKLDVMLPCGDDMTGNNNLGKYIPELTQYNISDDTLPGYIMYTPFSVSPTDPVCVAFHLAITLQSDTTGIFANGDADFNSTPSLQFPYVPCGDTGSVGFDGSVSNKYDIFKQ